MPKARVESALRELIEQGAPLERLSSGAPLMWRGESWADREEDYRHAFGWAQLLATSIPGREADDLRLHANCALSGRCSYQYDVDIPALPPDRYQRVKALAYEMQAALRQKDASPFLTAKP